eukprot:scaffold21372_cov129-Isochrysis_galbana.AAC.4
MGHRRGINAVRGAAKSGQEPTSPAGDEPARPADGARGSRAKAWRPLCAMCTTPCMVDPVCAAPEWQQQDSDRSVALEKVECGVQLALRPKSRHLNRVGFECSRDNVEHLVPLAEDEALVALGQRHHLLGDGGDLGAPRAQHARAGRGAVVRLHVGRHRQAAPASADGADERATVGGSDPLRAGEADGVATGGDHPLLAPLVQADGTLGIGATRAIGDGAEEGKLPARVVQLAARRVELGAVGHAPRLHVMPQHKGGTLDHGNLLEGIRVLDDGDSPRRD